jgi:hypothetical protein
MLAKMSLDILKLKNAITLKYDHLRHRFIQTVLAASVCVIIFQSLAKHFLFILHKMISLQPGKDFKNITGIPISVS